MDPRSTLRALGALRIALGASILVAPKTFAPLYLPEGRETPAARMLARMVGGRDIALGAGLLLADRHDGPVRGWIEAGMVADATDAIATLLARDHRAVPRFGLATAGLGAVALGRWLVSQTED